MPKFFDSYIRALYNSSLENSILTNYTKDVTMFALFRSQSISVEHSTSLLSIETDVTNRKRTQVQKTAHGVHRTAADGTQQGVHGAQVPLDSTAH